MIVPMQRIARLVASTPQTLALAARGLRTLSARQLGVAAVSTVLFGGLLGLATVLIPNSLFTREIPPVWWNYPVWILTSVCSGLLFATYVRATNVRDGRPGRGTGGAWSARVDGVTDEAGERRLSRAGVTGAFLAWFAVGCPVCNKLALLALGYSGALTWFAPAQPVLAVVALALTGVALVVRLRGRVACPLPRVPAAAEPDNSALEPAVPAAGSVR